ncbi:MAG: copper chaperone PCu(A)C [Pelagibacterium sp.]|uniref:copper chaperone PCu(A)C n=1 Tax=Pelagibacterium sp. TaxID=1967288 RepID=UPI0032F00D35
MIRAALFSLALLATPAFAQEDHADEHHEEHEHEEHEEHEHEDGEHDEHLAEANGIRAIHAWANATDASSALVYVDIENTSADLVTLIGAETEIATSIEIVGLENTAGELTYTAIPALPIPAGADMVFAPNGLAIALTGLTTPLVEGEHFDLELEFDGFHLDLEVEIESATATQHSHAGHNH